MPKLSEIHRGGVWVILTFVATACLAVDDASAQVRIADSKLLEMRERAAEQLMLYPDDAYLQYVVLQLGKQTGRADESTRQVERLLRNRRRLRQEVDAFGLFSGALAVQESLQLETLGTRRGSPVPEADAGNRQILVGSLEGPTIKSHPWAEMLAGKNPSVSRLAMAVPADSFFIKAKRTSQLLEIKELGDLWAKHLITQATRHSRSQLFAERMIAQLALDANDPLRPLYDSAAGEVALTGSDLFFREGTDLTLLFEVKQPAVFKARMDLFLAEAVLAHPDAERSEGEYLGVAYTFVGTADRRLHVFSAYPTEDLHVRSNSLVGLQRVLAAIRGEDEQGRAVERLGATDEFKYIRTLMEPDAEEEDLFVYLSDPFIRNLVGPQVKLTELRRMQCYNHLRMIGHAGLLYRTLTGEYAKSIQQLVDSGCAPSELLTEIRCPDGGQYRLSEDGLTAVCSHHGHARNLTPCCEIPVRHITTSEARLYRTFLERYNQYWRRFFDPIAIRVSLTERQYRVETIILPLIDNTIYSGLAEILGGEPENLEPRALPARNIFTANFRINKRVLARSFGLEPILAAEGVEAEQGRELAMQTESVGLALKQIGVAFHNFHDTYKRMPSSQTDGNGKPTGLSWRVHILPYMDRSDLYRQFHLDEPWDSEHNRKLISQMPEFYRPESSKLARDGKTQIVAPYGEGLLYEPNRDRVRIADITDGTSNTIMVYETKPNQAVVWTKPEDPTVDLSKPFDFLNTREPGAFPLVMCDGSVLFVRDGIEPERVKGLFTRRGREAVRYPRDDEVVRLQFRSRRRQRSSDGLNMAELGLGNLLMRGVGNQVGLHIYDNDPLIGFSIPMLVGEMVREVSADGRIDDDFMFIGMLIASLSSPVYVSVPVEDEQIVDQFLQRLDKQLAELARQMESGMFFRVQQDFYRFSTPDLSQARAYSIEVGPIKMRVFWARIGDGLFVASKPQILEDLVAASQLKTPTPTDPAAVGHAMLRLRPEQWDQILSSFQMGWSESHRSACIENLGPLTNLQQALGRQGAADSSTLDDLSRKVYDAHFYCPEGGHYHVAADGSRVFCSHHGSVHDPQQKLRLSADSAFGQLIKQLHEITLTLTFLEDGLHAVVTIDRQ